MVVWMRRWPKDLAHGTDAAVAARLGLDAGFCRRYLNHIIHFDLGPRELEGLRHFHGLACDLGLARPEVALEFYESSKQAVVGTI